MQSRERPIILVFAGILAVGTIASVLLSIVSLMIAMQARNQGLPALAYDAPRAAVLHTKHCTETAQNNAMYTQYDVEYVVTMSNSGGRSTNLLHTTLVSGAQKDIPWPVALTNSLTNFGAAIDKGQSTFVLTPADVPSGQSKKMSVNGRMRLNGTDASQRTTANAIKAGGTLQLTLVLSNGSRKIMGLPYTVHDDDAAEQSTQCVHAGDFHYHLDQE